MSSMKNRSIRKFDYLLHQNSNMFHCNYQTYTSFRKIEHFCLARNLPWTKYHIVIKI